MNTKKTALAVAALLAAQLAHAGDFQDTAKVVNVQPLMERVNQPYQVCDQAATQAAPQSGGLLGSIIGGVAGALLGAQVGHGNGRVAASAVGAGVGAMTGDRLQNAPGQAQPAQNCRMVDNWQARQDGYLVTYQYEGRTFTDPMPANPGDTVPVQVHVALTR